MKKIISEFKVFIMRGNVLDLAVGVIIGGAFQKIISSLVNDIIMPIISICTGGIDFSNLFISLDGKQYSSLQEATAANASTLNYGVFITETIDFLIMAFVIFIMVKTMNTLTSKVKRITDEKNEPTIKTCPFCKSSIAIDATRCPHCTSLLEETSLEKHSSM